MTLLPSIIRNMTDDELLKEAEICENPVALALSIRLISLHKEINELRNNYGKAIDEMEKVLND